MSETQESVYQQVEKQAKSIHGLTQLVTQVSNWFEKPTELTESIRERMHAILMVLPRYLAKIPHNEDNIMLEVVGYKEDRQIEAVKKPGSDQIDYLAVVSGTSKAFIDLRTPNGQIYRLPIEDNILESICNCKEFSISKIEQP